MSEYYLSTGQFAKVLDVSTKTICVWEDQKRIRCVRTLGGHRKFPPEEVQRVIQLMAEGGWSGKTQQMAAARAEHAETAKRKAGGLHRPHPGPEDQIKAAEARLPEELWCHKLDRFAKVPDECVCYWFCMPECTHLYLEKRNACRTKPVIDEGTGSHEGD